MKDAIAGFAFWALVLFLAYFGLPMIVYAVAMFISWGANWNPAGWAQNVRAGVAAFWVGWAVIVTMALADLA